MSQNHFEGCSYTAPHPGHSQKRMPLYSVKPFLEKWVWYFRSITVPLLDRSILWRIFVFPGVVRLPIATQTADVPKLRYSPLLLLDGGEFISEVDWEDWDRFLWAAPKKRTSHSKRMCTTHKYISETYPTLHHMPKMSKFEVTACFVWSLLERDS